MAAPHAHRWGTFCARDSVFGAPHWIVEPPLCRHAGNCCLNKWHEGTENRSKGTDNRNKRTGVLFEGSDEQVTRVRNKWKVLLKDGVMSIHGRDYIFKKASCEFEW